MNFKGLEQIKKGEFYLDTAINRTKKIPLDHYTGKDKWKKDLEKIKVTGTYLADVLRRITTCYPNFDNLPEFYLELTKIMLDVDKLKKALSSINWASEKIRELTFVYKKELISRNKESHTNFASTKPNRAKMVRGNKGQKVKKNTNPQQDMPNFARANSNWKDFLGRVSSIMKRIESHLAYLEHARRTMLDFPAIKTDVFTISIAGFPNVGKSTLLSKMTTAKPKIGDYAFTTTTINTGYYNLRLEKIQVIDVPGTLARFNQMNAVEKQAYLAIKYVSNVIVFVYDLTGSYSIEDQDNLFEIITEFRRPIIVYLSKTDLLKQKQIDDFLNTHKFENEIVCTDIEELKKQVIVNKK